MPSRLTERAREIFRKKPKPCRDGIEATKKLRKRVRDSGRASRNKKDDNKPFIQKTLPHSIYREIERESLHTHKTEGEKK